MAQHKPLLVPGAKPERENVTITAPFDGTHIATIETAGIDATQKALETSHGSFRDRDSWIPTAKRIGILEKTVSLMVAQRQELAVDAAREGGKPSLIHSSK